MSENAVGGVVGHFYVDPWQEYKQISGKLKKRFLRKPNVSEATKEFANLAIRMKEEECSQYGALCRLAAARCEHQVGNAANEGANLREAARLFMECELDKAKMNLPSFAHNLNSAVHCYGHAVKSYAEQKQFFQAGNICIELGMHLLRLDRPYESIEYFDKAIKFYKNQPIFELLAFEFAYLARILNFEYKQALKLLEKAKNSAIANFLPARTAVEQYPRKPVGYLKKFLTDVELTRVLLILLICQDRPPETSSALRLSDDESRLLKKYANFFDTGSSSNTAGTTISSSNATISWSTTNTLDTDSYLDSDCFILVQSLVLAVQNRDYRSIDFCLTDLRPYLNHFTLDLALELADCVKNLHKND